MTRGLKITILIIGGVIAIALIAYFVIFPIFKGNETPGPAQNANAGLPSGSLTNASQEPEKPENPPPPSEVAPEVEQASVARSVALTFAERIGTYTSDNGFANLADLKDISTSAVWKYIDGEYRGSLSKALPLGYYRVTSKAMNADVSLISDTEVSAVVQVQKTESGEASNTSYTVLDLKLKNSDGRWLVSWMEWE
jgi:hypothetical protein